MTGLLILAAVSLAALLFVGLVLSMLNAAGHVDELAQAERRATPPPPTTWHPNRRAGDIPENPRPYAAWLRDGPKDES